MAKVKGVTKKLDKVVKPKKLLKKSASVTSKLKLGKTLKNEGKKSLTLLKLQNIVQGEKNKELKALKPKQIKSTDKSTVLKVKPKVKVTVKKEIKSELNDQKTQIDIKPYKGRFDFTKESGLNTNQVNEGIAALLELSEKSKKVELFGEEIPIFMQIACIKVAKAPSRHVRVTLEHSLLSDSSEICLIVRDIGHKKDYDASIEHYEKFLKEHNITNVKTIIPFHQLKNEYDQFEHLRTLVDLYDCFLVDSKISGVVFGKLGKIFTKKRKQPTPLRFSATNFKVHYEMALKKVILNLPWKGDCHVVQIGHTLMKKEEIADNIIAATNQLDLVYAGGFANVRTLSIKTPNSIDIPIYLSLRSNSSIPVPVVKAKRPKKFTSITDELSTRLNTQVTILPSGEIVTRRMHPEVVSDKTKMKPKATERKKSLKVTITHNDKKEVVKEEVDSEEELERMEELYEKEYEETLKNTTKNKKKRTVSEGEVKKKGKKILRG